MRAYGVGRRQPAATRVGPGAGPRAAHEWFFPAAALYAAVVLPLSVAGMIAGFPPFPGLADPSGHAHELLFGYGLAVVAGFLINRIGRAALVLLFSLWLAARAAFLFAPDGVVTVFANVAFAVLLAVLAAPQFLKAAKKLRNRLTGPLVIALSAALVVFHGAVFASSGFVERLALHQAVLLFALLMLFMGGRILAPAIAGHVQRRGMNLQSRVQPRIEGALLGAMLLAIVAAPFPAAAPAAGIALLAAALLAAIRLCRWRLWLCGGRPDLLALAAGYAWLVAGLAWLGLEHSGLVAAGTTGLHAITAGALGTLTATVMLRTRLIKAGLDPAAAAGVWVPAALIAVAAIMRLSGGGMGILLAASGVWSAAFLAVFLALVRIPRRRSGKNLRRNC